MEQLTKYDNGLVKLPMQLSLRQFLSLNLEDMLQIQSGELVSSGWGDVRSWPRKLDKLLHLETGAEEHVKWVAMLLAVFDDFFAFFGR